MRYEIECRQWDVEYDVVVAGGGTTGCCAAIAAARQGTKVLIIEKLPFLGGNMSSGLPWLGFHAVDSNELVVKGIPLEIIERLQNENGATSFIMDPIAGSAVGVNGTMLKIMLSQIIAEEGIDVLLHSLVTGVSTVQDAVSDVIVQNKEGCQRIKAKVFIDCTDSVDLCQHAGVENSIGRARDHHTQVSSYVLTFGTIDYEEMFSYFSKNTDQIRPFPLSEKARVDLLSQMRVNPLCVLGAFPTIIAQARAEGVDYPRDYLVGIGYPPVGELSLVSSRVHDVNPNDILNHSHAELEGFRQTKGIIQLLRKYIPGCSKARLISSGTQLGIRETRHIFGEYVLTSEDLMNATKFSDSIARGAYHLDIHTPDHAGLETQRPKIYYIPLRCLIAKGVTNLLVAGRGISATHEALSSTRVTPISGALGEAAGVAAALAAHNITSVKNVSIMDVQTILRKSNCRI